MTLHGISKKNIDFVNKSDNEIFIELNNTKKLNSTILNSIVNNNCKFIIYGGIKDIEFLPRYKGRIIYSIEEMKLIIKKIETIEKKLPNNEFDKIIWIYDYIRKNIKYYPNEPIDHNIRSLKVLINKKAVCSGYSLLLKELLERQNIRCKYIKYYNHIWNTIYFNKKNYIVDITWDACVYDKCKSSNLHYFANCINLNNEHHNYKINNNYLSNNLIKEYKLLTMELKRENNTFFKLTLLPIGYKRKYYLFEENNKKYIINSEDDFEIIYSKNDKQVISSYINCFFTESRVIKYMKNGISYIGYGVIKDGIFYRKKKSFTNNYINEVKYDNNIIIIYTKEGIFEIDNYYNFKEVQNA